MPKHPNKKQYQQKKRTADRLDELSGLAFFIGIVLAKLRYLIPLPIVTTVLNGISLALYVVGYGLWLIECFFDPHKDKKASAWYGFATIKEQFGIASIIGLIATALGIAAIFMPILIIPSCCLFTLSNFIWAMGEYQKKKVPVDKTNPYDRKADEDFSDKKQNTYLKYAIIATAVSLISTLLTITAFFIPAITIYVLLATAYIGGIVVKAWYDAITCKAEKTPKTEYPVGFTPTPSLPNEDARPQEETPVNPRHTNDPLTPSSILRNRVGSVDVFDSEKLSNAL